MGLGTEKRVPEGFTPTAESKPILAGPTDGPSAPEDSRASPADNAVCNEILADMQVRTRDPTARQAAELWPQCPLHCYFRMITSFCIAGSAYAGSLVGLEELTLMPCGSVSETGAYPRSAEARPAASNPGNKNPGPLAAPGSGNGYAGR